MLSQRVLRQPIVRALSEPEDLTPRFVEGGAGKIAYYTARSPHARAVETVLLIHGAGMSARSWGDTIESLSRNVDVLAIDLPGHGASDPIDEVTVERYVDATITLLTNFGIGPVFVAGHSLGGSVALALASSRPDLVKGLILVSTCAKIPRDNNPMKALLGALPAPLRRMLFFTTARSMLFGVAAPGDAVQIALNELRDCPPETIKKDVAAAEAMDLESAAQQLGMPTLILCGTADMVTPMRLSERLHQLVPGSQLEIAPRVGHMLPLEAPEWTNEKILAFVGWMDAKETRKAVIVEPVPPLQLVRQLVSRVRALYR